MSSSMLGLAGVSSIGSESSGFATQPEERSTNADHTQEASSSTGARPMRGFHQSRLSRYQRIVDMTPLSKSTSGRQPTSRRIFVLSSR